MFKQKYTKKNVFKENTYKKKKKICQKNISPPPN